MKPVQLARSPWTDLVLVCSKCARKAGAKSFRKDLKGALKKAGSGKRIRLADTSCLDLCPKKRIVLALGSDLARRRLVVSAPDAADAIAALLIAKMSGPANAFDSERTAP